MRHIIDFRQVRFTECFENPYRITPPRRDTLYSKALADVIDFHGKGLNSHSSDKPQATKSSLDKGSLDSHIDAEGSLDSHIDAAQNEASLNPPSMDSHSSSRSNPADIYPRIAISEVQDSLVHLFSQKKQQTSAFLGVVGAEMNVIKTSIFATVFAGFAAVLLAGVCWLMINALIGLGLHSLGSSVAFSIVIILVLNIVLFTFTVYIAKKTSRYARFERIINVIKEL